MSGIFKRTRKITKKSMEDCFSLCRIVRDAIKLDNTILQSIQPRSMCCLIEDFKIIQVPLKTKNH